MEPPSNFCSSEAARAGARSCALIERRSDGGVLNQFSLHAGFQHFHQRFGLALFVGADLEQHVPFVLALKRIAHAVAVLQHDVEPKRERISNVFTFTPAIDCARLSKASAACGEGMPMNAVSSTLGRGYIFTTAAVMIPSVPSEPMNRCFRS